MNAAARLPERFSEDGDYSVEVAEVFAAGSHAGKDYTPADIGQIAANFQKVSKGPDPLHPVPLTLGHEPEDPDEPWPGQDLLDGAGLPAAGWVADAWGEGPLLCCRFERMGQEIADLVAAGAYRKVSAEIYPPGYPHGLPVEGLVLRAVALLGADIPKVKGLAQIPRPVRNSEPRLRRQLRIAGIRQSKAGTILVFSEVAPELSNQPYGEEIMDRDTYLQELGKLGYDTSVFTPETPDAVLQEILRRESSKKDLAQNADSPDKPDGTQPPVNPPAPDPDKYDPDKMDDDMEEPTDAASYAEYCRKMGERLRRFAGKCGVQYDEKVIGQSTMGDVTADGKPKTTEPEKYAYAEARKELAQLRADLKKARAEMAQVQTFAEERNGAERKLKTAAEIEVHVKAGKLSRAEADTHIELAMLQDHARVLTFSEAGKPVKATALERYLAGVKKLAESRTSLFSDRVRSRGAIGAATSLDDEVAEVAEHWETYSEDFKRIGTTKDGMVAAFKKAKERDPQTTVKTFLSPRATARAS